MLYKTIFAGSTLVLAAALTNALFGLVVFPVVLNLLFTGITAAVASAALLPAFHEDVQDKNKLDWFVGHLGLFIIAEMVAAVLITKLSFGAIVLTGPIVMIALPLALIVVFQIVFGRLIESSLRSEDDDQFEEHIGKVGRPRSPAPVKKVSFLPQATAVQEGTQFYAPSQSPASGDGALGGDTNGQNQHNRLRAGLTGTATTLSVAGGDGVEVDDNGVEVSTVATGSDLPTPPAIPRPVTPPTPSVSSAEMAQNANLPLGLRDFYKRRQRAEAQRVHNPRAAEISVPLPGTILASRLADALVPLRDEDYRSASNTDEQKKMKRQFDSLVSTVEGSHA